MISKGHSPLDVWGYSPRQITAFLILANKREKALAAQNIMIARVAQAESKDVERIMGELAK